MSDTVTLDPWPNKLGVNVLLDGVKVGEVLKQSKGVSVRTFTASGEPDLALKITQKVDPEVAVFRCLLEGEPVEAS